MINTLIFSVIAEWRYMFHKAAAQLTRRNELSKSRSTTDNSTQWIKLTATLAPFIVTHLQTLDKTHLFVRREYNYWTTRFHKVQQSAYNWCWIHLCSNN